MGWAEANAKPASSLLPPSIAFTTFFMLVRSIERKLALCLRCFSACLARFFACTVLAKGNSPEKGPKNADDAASPKICQETL